VTDTPGVLSPEMVTSLLKTAQRVAERGDLARARALLRTLAEQAPGDWQVWQALAVVAENDAERMAALERLAALADRGPRVTRRLDERDNPPAPAGGRTTARLTGEEPPATDGRRTTAPLAPGDAPQARRTTARLPSDEGRPAAPQRQAPSIAALDATTAPPAPRRAAYPAAEEWTPPRAAEPAEPPAGWFRSHWLTYASIAVIAILLLGVLLLARERLSASAVQPTATPVLATPDLSGATAAPPVQSPLPTAALPTVAPQEPTAVATVLPAETPAAPPPTAAVEPTTGAAEPTADAGAPTSVAATPAAPQGLALGQVVDRGDWSVTVLQPSHLLPLNGSIGSLPPQGRFVLALVAVGNRGVAPARVPEELLVLVDNRGNRYAPIPSASTAYLSAYGRGVRGDLSLEEEVPADAGIVSIPVIFDVPADAGGLVLQVEGAPSGWPYGQ
jgi:hypothetical protein